MEYPNNIYPAGFIGPLPPGGTRATATSPDLLKGSTSVKTTQPKTASAKTTQPVVVPPQIQQQSNPMALFMAMNAMQSQTKANNVLMTQRNLLLKQLYDTPLTSQEVGQLDPTMKQAIQTNNRDQIDMSLRLISDQIQGRTASIDQSFQYLSTQYINQIEKAETQRQQAQETVLSYAKTLNAPPSKVAAALGVQGNFSALDTLYESAPAEAGGGTTSKKDLFTQTQLNKGAATAGVSMNDFGNSDDDSKNYFVNTTTLNSYKKIVDDAFKNAEDPATLEAEISSGDLPDEVKNFLVKYLWTVFPRPTATAPTQTKSWWQIWK